MLSEPVNSPVNRFSGWTRVTWKMLAVWEKLSRGLVKTHPPITSRNHFQKLLSGSISPCHHLFSFSCSELNASAKCQRCPIAFIHKGEESSVILKILLSVYVFGFGDSLYQIWHSLKNWGNFMLQSFKIMMENLVLFGLFLLLLWGSSLSKDLFVQPSEKIGRWLILIQFEVWAQRISIVVLWSVCFPTIRILLNTNWAEIPLLHLLIWPSTFPMALAQWLSENKLSKSPCGFE